MKKSGRYHLIQNGFRFGRVADKPFIWRCTSNKNDAPHKYEPNSFRALKRFVFLFMNIYRGMGGNTVRKIKYIQFWK